MNGQKIRGRLKSIATQSKSIREVFRFGAVGIINNIISLLIYYIVVFINRDWYLAGNILGFLISTLNAWFMNSRYVFRSDDQNKRSPKETLIRTYITYMISLGISTALLYFFVDKLKINEKLAPIGCLMITVAFNFFMNKFWIYRTHIKCAEKERKSQERSGY